MLSSPGVPPVPLSEDLARRCLPSDKSSRSRMAAGPAVPLASRLMGPPPMHQMADTPVGSSYEPHDPFSFLPTKAQTGRVMKNGSVKQTRILLAEMPTLMSDLVEGMLSGQPDLHVVARIPRGEDLRAAVRRNNADVLIIGSTADIADEAVLPAAFIWRPTKLIKISDGGERGMLWVLRPDATLIGELSSDSLIAAARVTGSS
jgi:hypothetical protein